MSENKSANFIINHENFSEIKEKFFNDIKNNNKIYIKFDYFLPQAILLKNIVDKNNFLYNFLKENIELIDNFTFFAKFNNTKNTYIISVKDENIFKPKKTHLNTHKHTPK